ncbi:long-chain fatty acid--CoA ligase [Streptomyces sp. YC504]|uniref:Long-chain fatty acid--CoA ligase n=1 Tax=Streptomyces mesophilus TaxID=1775132 RepID=A0A6G4X9C9_9ACTN|nr:long-chain fatty acid--CoA ligase [Streptomyces mesophilus]NGO74146.1 long-chain fatty acid--CoA ligase [Streptomyces mesophilus]
MYLTQSLHRAVQHTPDALATLYGERTRTHRESVDRIARFAGALRSFGIGDQARVGLLALNSDRYHETLFATWWAGGAVNPVNTRWSSKEIAYSLQESNTRVLVVDDTFVPLVDELRALWDGVHTVVHCGDGPTPPGLLSYEELVAGHDPLEDERAGGDRLAGIFYTGGTTGFPKGVMLSHASMLTSAYCGLATTRTVSPRGRTLHCAPLFHLAGLAVWNNQNVMGGSHIFLPAFEPTAVLTAIQDLRPTSLLLVPAMIQMLVDHPAAGDHDLDSVEWMGYGASPIAEALLRRAMARFPRAQFAQGYGMTELSPVATHLGPEDHARPELLRSAGRAVAGTEVMIVDPEDREVPRGAVGEIVVRGGGIMLGYWNRPEETAQTLRGGWMHTGDAGYMNDEGYIFIVDRIKDMIVTGGENVFSAEVENALAQHPAVASCAVIGVPDPEWGERVHAVVVTQPGAEVTAAELRLHCKEFIAGYKAPRTVDFCDALPLSPAGKILKRELRKPYWEQAERSVS